MLTPRQTAFLSAAAMATTTLTPRIVNLVTRARHSSAVTDEQRGHYLQAAEEALLQILSKLMIARAGLRVGATADQEQHAMVARAYPRAGSGDAERLLVAAAHALRSYQYGNSAPALAAGIADEIDAMLGTSSRDAAPLREASR